MNERRHEVRVLVNEDELARLDEHRGALSRAGYCPLPALGAASPRRHR